VCDVTILKGYYIRLTINFNSRVPSNVKDKTARG